MIRRAQDMKPQRREHLQGGAGGSWNTYAVSPETEMEGSHFRMISTIRLDPGAEVGLHTHLTNEELFVILEGRGLYTENGEIHEVGPGDMLVLPRTHQHGIRNLGEGPLTFLAVIVD